MYVCTAGRYGINVVDSYSAVLYRAAVRFKETREFAAALTDGWMFVHPRQFQTRDSCPNCTSSKGSPLRR